jgi:serine/threonine protein phosphatase PrpC
MEDAAIHELAFPNNHALFAVFDGHGGTRWVKQDLKSVDT